MSVVVPCRDSSATIRATVDALLGQEYPRLDELILVGSTGDTTWSALADVTDPRLVLLEQEPVPGLRDPAVKRDKGVRKASGEVIALADSDIVMEPDWLRRGVGALVAQGGGVVAGGMRSIHDTFWGRFVNKNRLGAKTPRLTIPYLVTARNFGRHNRKPPITANVILTREVYDDQPIDRRLDVRVRGLRVVLAGRQGRPPDPVHRRAHRAASPPPQFPAPGDGVPAGGARLREVHQDPPGQSSRPQTPPAGNPAAQRWARRAWRLPGRPWSRGSG